MHAHSSRKMSDSPRAVVRAALAAAQDALPVYSCAKSKHDFTQQQLFAILVLRYFFNTNLRRVVTMLAEWSDLREELGLTKVPHYSTLCYAEKRLLKKAGSMRFCMPSSNGAEGVA
jgi:hypothetical protein